MTASKIVAAAASGVGGEVLDIDDVFSTYLYTGTGSALTITNGIDLSGEGGLVWTKRRNSANSHWFLDSVRGGNQIMRSNTTEAQFTSSGLEITSFNSNGYTLGTDANINSTSGNDVSWTFRKAPKFFDVVTYTGTGSAQNISHNLGSVPGMIIIKKTSTTSNWFVYHRSLGEGKFIKLNETDPETSNTFVFDNTAPTSTEFTIGQSTNTNANGVTYVAYLFAHNDGDGDFGPDGDADIIKCGSYSGNGATTGVFQDLGFEPQWIIFKETTITEPWVMLDNMRGVTGSGSNDPRLQANSTVSEAGGEIMQFNATGFTPLTADDKVNGSGRNYIYMAIRRGPLAEPESATDVFGINAYSGDGTTGRIISMGFPTDLGIIKIRSPGGDTDNLSDRLRGPNKFLTATATNAENTSSTNRVIGMDNMTGFEVGADTQVNYTGAGYGTYVMWGWKRAPKYFDMVAYTGTGSTRTVNHNLGVAPEMMWVKRRDGADNWNVYHSALGNQAFVGLDNSNAAVTGNNNRWNSTSPTASVFTVASAGGVNDTGGTYIAHLFATLAGISKVGSFTNSGSNVFVDCGFSSSARFVVFKRSSGSGDWLTFDSERGYAAGSNDARLKLESTTAEFATGNFLDPTSGGFTVTGGSIDSGTYIFYAIA